jgi:hypothetical protein
MIYEDMKDAGKVISAFTVYKFIKLITLPFSSFDAYKYGIIDSKGNFLKKVDTLTKTKEKKSVDAFYRLVINLKKIINKVPDPSLKAQLKTIPTAMILLKDEVEKIGGDGDLVLQEIKNYMYTENNININLTEENK